MKKYLIHIKQEAGLELQELAFALGAFEQHVCILFSNKGISQLIDKEETKFKKDYKKAYQALEMFGITKVYADLKSATEHSKLIKIAYEEVTNIDELINEFDVVIDL